MMPTGKHLLDNLDEAEALVQIANREKRNETMVGGDGYANTFQTAEIGPKIFDPALKHYTRAMRAGDPAFTEDTLAKRWHGARRDVINHLLTLISRTRWKDHLVLRGSLLLKLWMGEQAREPGDIDWVFQPARAVLGDLLSQELFRELRQLVTEQPRVGDAVINAARITEDDIWTYERASGRRIVFPWRVEGLPRGSVQMDVVFSEALFDAPITVNAPTRGGTVSVLAATPELSLAWKLLWLQTDMYPQGKDLYDATLLAERTALSLDLLYKVLATSEEWREGETLQPDFAMDLNVEWDDFTREHPWVEGNAEKWQERLCRALAPAFRDGLRNP